MICIQLKIKCKTILLKTLENGLNKSYFMTYQCPTEALMTFYSVWPIWTYAQFFIYFWFCVLGSRECMVAEMCIQWYTSLWNCLTSQRHKCFKHFTCPAWTFHKLNQCKLKAEDLKNKKNKVDISNWVK